MSEDLDYFRVAAIGSVKTPDLVFDRDVFLRAPALIRLGLGKLRFAIFVFSSPF